MTTNTTCSLNAHTELLWRVVGYDTHKMMNQSVLCVTDTKAQAYATVTANHPNLDVYFVQRVDDEDTSWMNYPWNAPWSKRDI